MSILFFILPQFLWKIIKMVIKIIVFSDKTIDLS
ncbi:hypothetical protein [Staphylococcus phage PT94]